MKADVGLTILSIEKNIYADVMNHIEKHYLYFFVVLNSSHLLLIILRENWMVIFNMRHIKWYLALECWFLREKTMTLGVFESDSRWELASILFFLLTDTALNSCRKALSRDYNSHRVHWCRVRPSQYFWDWVKKTPHIQSTSTNPCLNLLLYKISE